MIKLVDINEDNWLDVMRLEINADQQAYLASPVGILARGYVYRGCNARVIGIAKDNQIIGVALVRDFTDEPVGYDLQQFMIDRRFQNKGYGTEALKLILASLKQDGRYSDVEICVNKADASALRVYEKAGFADSGYIDADLPDCVNLVYHLK